MKNKTIKFSNKASGSMKRIAVLFVMLLLIGGCQKPDPINKENIIWSNETVGYVVQNEICYLTEDGGKTFSECIGREQAIKLATAEGTREKYQYQEWESNFQNDRSQQNTVQFLVKDEKTDRFLAWKYGAMDQAKYLWEVRLLDQNDPLTSLFVYIDAVSGNICAVNAVSD